MPFEYCICLIQYAVGCMTSTATRIMVSYLVIAGIILRFRRSDESMMSSMETAIEDPRQRRKYDSGTSQVVG